MKAAASLFLLLGALSVLFLSLPEPGIEAYLSPLAEASFSPPVSGPAQAFHREVLPRPVAPGTVLLATVTLSGGADTVAFLDNGGPATSKKRGIELLAPSSRDRTPVPQTWKNTFVAPPGPGPLVFTVAWKGVPAEVGRIALASVSPRYFHLQAGLRAARLLTLLGTVASGLFLLRRRLAPDRFAALVGRRLLPLGLAALVAFGLLVRWDGNRGPHGHRYGFTSLCNMGSGFLAQATPAARALDFKVVSFLGYDGDQYVQLALDPLLLDRPALARALDVPAYRAKRILLPAAAWLAGLGHAPWVVQAYCLLNGAFWLLLLCVLRRAFPAPTLEEGAAMAAVLLSVGALESLRRALTDLPAASLLALALHLAERGKPSPLLFSSALLARESTLLSLPLLLRRKFFSRSFLLSLGAGLLAVGGWFVYVTLRFPGPGGGTAHNFSWPLLALGERLALVFRGEGWGDPANRATFLALFGLLVQAAFLLRHPRPASAAWRTGILYVPLFLCLGRPVLEEYPAAARALLPLTLAFHWELARTRRGAAFWAWALPANLALWDGLSKYLFPAG